MDEQVRLWNVSKGACLLGATLLVKCCSHEVRQGRERSIVTIKGTRRATTFLVPHHSSLRAVHRLKAINRPTNARRAVGELQDVSLYSARMNCDCKMERWEGPERSVESIYA